MCQCKVEMLFFFGGENTQVRPKFQIHTYTIQMSYYPPNLFYK